MLFAQELFGERSLLLEEHPTASFGYFAHFGQVDGTGPQDLLTSSASTIVAASLEVMLNNDTATPFSEDPVFVIDQGISFYYFGVADMNNDGFDDLLTDPGIYFWNPENDSYGFQAFFEDQNLFCLTHGDVNGDELIDVLLRDNDRLYLALNQGDGSLGAPTIINPDISGDTTIPDPLIADFSGDGKADILVYPTFFNQAFFLYVQLADGSFESITLPLSREQLNGGFSPAVASVMAGVDYDTDGDLDIIYEHENGVYMLLNEGEATFNTVDTLLIKNQIARQQYHDLNLDGVIDVVQTRYNSSDVDILVRDSAGATVQSINITGGAYNTLINPIFTDYDLDGDLDLVEFAFEDNTQKLYLRLNNTIEAPNNTFDSPQEMIDHHIWPNPTQEQFRIQLNDSAFRHGKLVLFGQDGKKLLEYPLQIGENQLTLPSSTPKGQLWYQIQEDSGTVLAAGKLIHI